jgi:voltage-gated potassium channel
MIRSGGHSARNRAWEILEPPAIGDRASRFFDLFMIVVILASVGGVVVRTVVSVAGPYAVALQVVEYATVAVFSAEILLRLWVADLVYPQGGTPRLAYLRSPEGLVDMVAVAPLLVGLFVSAGSPLLIGLALLRIFKLVRSSPAMGTLRAVLVNERSVLLGAVTIMLVLLLFSSTVIYLVERKGQPEAFGSIPAAMWWGMSTLTTVGYGDVTPITPLGKLFGAIVTLLGVGMFALPAGILSSGFTRELKQRRFLRTTELVASVPLFEGLSAHDIARISRVLDPLIVQAGQIVVRQGQDASSMFFVAGGALEVDIDGHLERLTTEFFGEIGLLEGGVRSATIRALTRCQLLVLEQRHFKDLLESNPPLEEAVRRAHLEHRAADVRRMASSQKDESEAPGSSAD